MNMMGLLLFFVSLASGSFTRRVACQDRLHCGVKIGNRLFVLFPCDLVLLMTLDLHGGQESLGYADILCRAT